MKKHRMRTKIMLAAVMVCTALAGCTGEKPTGGGAPKGLGDSYPLETEQTLTYWTDINFMGSSKSLNDTPFAAELSRLTGVGVAYIQPNKAQVNEQLNLMLASGDLPDIIECYWTNFPGGPQKAIDEDYIIRLNEAIESYSPHFKKALEGLPEVQKQIQLDSGSYYVYPFVRSDESLLVSVGPIIRQDWLTELGLAIPETMDEWHHVLTEFKTRKNADAPLQGNILSFMESNAFVGAFGIGGSYYQQNGRVKYGPYEPGFKDFILTMRKWYKEQLLDNNFPTTDGKAMDANLLNGNSGATVSALGSGMGRWLAAAKDKNTGFDLAGAPYPVLHKGDRPMFSQRQLPYPGRGTAITGKCKNVELAARFIDFSYSEQGNMLNNFGMEGVSYNMVDGYPQYTPLIMQNPDGLSVAGAMSEYLRAYHYGPFIQDKRYMEQYASLPQQRQAWEVWEATDMKDYSLPHLFVQQENINELAKITSEINTYQSEMIIKLVMGVEPIDNYEKYIGELKSIGIERAVELKQEALDRYNQR